MSRHITGGCLCGSVRYSADAEPVVQGACHCSDCQHQTGGPFTVFVGVPTDAFSIEGETLGTYNTPGADHDGETQRSFCTSCGAPIFSLSPLAPGVTLIKAGSLDDGSWLQPGVEFFMGSAQPWSPHFADAATYDRGPG
jgi:hypothetical protein